MDVIKISLEALLQRATNPQNQNIDTAAVEAFCTLINKEKEGPLLGVKLLASRIHSKNEQEVLQALHILDVSMQKCGTPFQSEVGKFRFLNEMIKLVSPKYLGCYTAISVKQKVLQLMYLWTLDYPKETKIREAYDMLKKQGVIKEVPLSVSAEKYTMPESKVNTIFQDEERSKLLKKLLQSKNPEDLQAANRLIKTMVKEDERKAELKSKRISELESVQNNVRLLSEMLDSYRPGLSSQDEFDLIRELHESCERLRPNIVKLASETQQNEEILVEILKANDELGLVFDKYDSIIVKDCGLPADQQRSLLDLTGNSTTNLVIGDNPTVNNSVSQSNIDVLCDILTPQIYPETLILDNGDENILKPTSLANTEVLDIKEPNLNNKMKALEDLDTLGKNLLQENLQSASRMGSQFTKPPEKVPMNLLVKPASTAPSADPDSDKNGCAISLEKSFEFDLTNFLQKLDDSETSELSTDHRNDSSIDDLLVDISEDGPEKPLPTSSQMPKPQNQIDEKTEAKDLPKSDLKLGSLHVDLKSVKPSSVKPVTALEDKNNVSVTLHFAKDKPHKDVSVVVVTIVSKNELPIKDVLFRAIVPKMCKVKLQTPSATELPSFNPFLPPAAITQIMLVANPNKVIVSLKFIISYTIEDEEMTEMGEIEELPILSGV